MNQEQTKNTINNLNQSELLQILTGLRIRTDAANAQLVQLGLLVEYLYEKLSKQGIEIPMGDFPKWAEVRYKEIQKQAEQAQKEGLMDDFKKSAEEAMQGINLTDTTE